MSFDSNIYELTINLTRSVYHRNRSSFLIKLLSIPTVPELVYMNMYGMLQVNRHNFYMLGRIEKLCIYFQFTDTENGLCGGNFHPCKYLQSEQKSAVLISN